MMTIGKAPRSLPVEIFDSPESMGEKLAAELVPKIQSAAKLFILGCPGGRTPKTTYQALSRLAAERGADLSKLVIAMMDDYVFPSGKGYVHCPEDAHYSCRRFAYEEIWNVVNG